MATKKRKLVSAIVAVSVAAALLLTGTFAWQSISQTALNEKIEDVNPGGRLHDDFDGTNKDVYVENFGTTPIFARVRLDEYMEIGEGAGLKTGAPDYDSKRAKPVKAGTDINDMSTWVTHIPGATAENDPFHKYVEWKMGGSTTYMPTFNKNKDSLAADINGTYEGTAKGDDTHYDDYHVYKPSDSKTEDAIYDADDNTVDEGNSAVNPDNIITKEETHTAKATLNATIMTMQEWIDAGAKPGPYWVYDVDGWAYWAQAIEPDTATGLLLDGIDQPKEPDDDWYYGINVVGQFATGDDLGDDTEDTGFYQDGLTDDAYYLLMTAAGHKETLEITTADNADKCLPGSTLQFTAKITLGGKEYGSQEVDWSISSAHTSGTFINTSGLLTVAAGETNAELTIKATSITKPALFVEKTIRSKGVYEDIGTITPGSDTTVTIDGIEFYVLAKEDGRAMLMTKDIQEEKAFDADSSRWQDSDMRTYLNSTWLNSKPTLQQHAVSTTIKTRSSYNGSSFDTTSDKVFLLSEADVFGTQNNSSPRPDDYTYKGKKLDAPGGSWIAKHQGSEDWYWLRSPRTNSDDVAGVSNGGSSSSYDCYLTNVGIRPVLWVNLAQ